MARPGTASEVAQCQPEGVWLVRISILLLTMLTLVAMLVACGEPSTQRQSRNIQRDIGQQAFAAVPPYHPSSYAAREDINWYLQETEQPGQTWYVYAINFSGEPMFYIVSDMKPGTSVLASQRQTKLPVAAAYAQLLPWMAYITGVPVATLLRPGFRNRRFHRTGGQHFFLDYLKSAPGTGNGPFSVGSR